MKFKILVADDSITIQKIVAMAFESEDMLVEGIGNGKAAYDFLGEYLPDIVLADIDMPGLTGFELSRKIKESVDFQDIKVLLLASDFEDFDQNQFEESKADGHISKPFKSEDIVQKVRSLLPGKPRSEKELEVAFDEEEEFLDSLPEPEPEESADESGPAESSANSIIDQEFESILEESREVLEETPDEVMPEVEPGIEAALDTEEGKEEEELLAQDISEEDIKEIEEASSTLEEELEAITEDAPDGDLEEEDEELSSSREVLNEVQEEMETLPEVEPETEDVALEEDVFLAEVNPDPVQKNELDDAFKQVTGLEEGAADLQEESVEAEPEKLLEEMNPSAFSSSDLESKPDLIKETLNYLSTVSEPAEKEPVAASEDEILEQAKALDIRNEKYNKVMGQHIMKVLEQSMDTSMRQEIGGISEGILQTVREVVKEIAPGIIRSVIKEEIENIKKAEQI